MNNGAGLHGGTKAIRLSLAVLEFLFLLFHALVYEALSLPLPPLPYCMALSCLYPLAR